MAFAEAPWLDGPVGAPEGIGRDWIAQHARRAGARLEPDPGGATARSTGAGGGVAGDGGGVAGLLPDMSVLDGSGFRAGDLRGTVRDFYETTARWDVDVWSRWARWAEPGGRALNAVFARRLRQLSLPLDALEPAGGMDSHVIALRTPAGEHLGTAWQRTLRATGATVFGGFYGVVRAPLAERPSIRVVFPLPNGSVTVLLRPGSTASGSLCLRSPPGPFGADGAYLVVRPDAGPRGWARRVPLPERFLVFEDASGELCCEHRLWLGRAEVLRLRYRLRPRLTEP